MSGIEPTKRVELGAIDLAYVEAGSGPETVVLSHSYLVDRRQFTAQIEALAQSHRVIAFDHRDHGESGRASGSYTLKTLVADTEALLDALDAGPCHFVGLSTGGFVGMRLALWHPDRLRSLTLMDTSAGSESPMARMKYRALLAVLGLVGPRPVVGNAMRSMFSQSFLDDPERQEEAATWRARIAANDPQALIRFGKAIFTRDEILEDLRKLDVPTLVVNGELDRGYGVARAEEIANAIPGAELAVIPGAGHLCTIEKPGEVNDVLVPFIRDKTASRS